MLKRILKMLAITLAVAVVTWLVLYAVGFRLYKVPTSSMSPTISKNEYILAKLSKDYENEVKRYDIIVFKSARPPYSIYTKRVVGLPGERLSYRRVKLTINGAPIELDFDYGSVALWPESFSITIPKDSVFVIGDNAINSADSRFNGPVPLENVMGKVLFKK